MMGMTKHFLAAAAAAVALMVPGTVQAQCDTCGTCDTCGVTDSYFAPQAINNSGRYFSLFGGVTAIDDQVSTGFQRNVLADFDEGFNVGGAIGRRINGGPYRVEGEFTYRNNDADEVTFNGNPQPGVDGGIDSYALMLNVYRDFNTNGRIRPYIGGGLGFAFVDSDFQYGGLPAIVDGSDSTFAYQAMAGVSAALRNNVDFFVEYRFFAADSPQLNRFGGPPINGAPQDIVLDSEYFTHGIQAGIRIKSW